MQDMADELLKLYAQRKAAQGHAFTPDNESSVSLKTPSITTRRTIRSRQLDDIKRDMESTMPMDRLLCGDVGYGQTEVAMRAAFKRCRTGKQVAVLTPTAVIELSTLRDVQGALQAIPDHIEMISRFRTPKEQKGDSGADRGGQGRCPDRHA